MYPSGRAKKEKLSAVHHQLTPTLARRQKSAGLRACTQRKPGIAWLELGVSARSACTSSFPGAWSTTDAVHGRLSRSTALSLLLLFYVCVIYIVAKGLGFI